MLQGSLTFIFVLLICLALMAMAVFWWQRDWFVQWLKGSAGFALLALAIFLFFSLWDIWSYQSLNKESPLVTVSIYEMGPQEFDLTLADNQGKEQRFRIRGDQWQLDVRLLTWQGPIAALGATPLYRLDRLSGRYLSLEQERNDERTLYNLHPSSGFDLWSLLYKHGFWLDAQYGSAVYMPLVNGAVYAVKLTPKGLIARPLNDVAEQALGTNW